MKHHGSILRDEISRYFPDLLEFEKYYHFINPLVLSVSDLPSEDSLVQAQFIDLVNDGDAKCVAVTFGFKWQRHTRKDGSKIVDSISYHLRVRKSVFRSSYYQIKISKQTGGDI